MINGVHHVQLTIPTGQEDAARTFYCGVLGLKEILKPQSLRQKGGLWLELANVQLHISIQENVDRMSLKSHVCFETQDLDSWRNKFAGHKIATDQNDPIPGIHRFMFRDPFGNRLEMLQRF